MYKMNKNKLIVGIVTACIIASPLVVMAAPWDNPPPFDQSPNLSGLIAGIMRAVWMVFAAIVIILFIYAGIRFLTAGGQPEKIQEARMALLWGVVGVIVVILAYSIFAIAQSIIGGNI